MNGDLSKKIFKAFKIYDYVNLKMSGLQILILQNLTETSHKVELTTVKNVRKNYVTIYQFLLY